MFLITILEIFICPKIWCKIHFRKLGDYFSALQWAKTWLP